MWKHVAGFVGGFGVILGLFTLAQRLSGYESKSLAAILVRLAIGLSVILVLALTWDTVHWLRKRKRAMPVDRPKVLPDYYGTNAGRQNTDSLHIVNDGIVAFDVEVDPVPLGEGWILQFEQPVHRLDAGEKTFFSVTAVNSALHTTHMGLDGVWRQLWEQKKVKALLPFTIKYRDFEGLRYRTICELHRDVTRSYPGFAVKFIHQEMA